MTRWEVFKQDAEGKPHQAVGSVHAADSEGALLNARHVFARRPAAVSLWVAPAAAVHAWTAEQLEGRAAGVSPAGRGPTFLVFCKTSNRRSMTFVDHVGEVQAPDPLAALSEARRRFADVPALAWWLVEVGAVTGSAPEDADAWFEPARDKTYKQQSAYGSVKPSSARRQEAGR